MPDRYGGYHEPFLGGGALFLSERPDHGYVGDVNPEVANLYAVIKHKPRADFTRYTADGFDAEAHRELWRTCVKLHRLGILWMVSNAHTPWVLHLWRAFRVDVIQAPRSIAAGARGRAPVREVLVRNY